MTDDELPGAVRAFIESSVPSLETLEIVLAVAREPGRTWRAGDVVRVVQPSRVSESSVKEYLDQLAEQGIVTAQGEDVWVGTQASPDVARALDDLLAAYNQRPVTLIRTLYQLAATRKIRSFADAFRLKKAD